MRLHHITIRMILALTLLALSGGAFGLVGHASAGGALGPRQVMTAYYAAINARDYTTAYSLWNNPVQTYAAFAAGYATTSSTQAYFGGLQAGAPGSTTGYLPAFLVGYHYDGTQEIYQGCYALTYNPAGSGLQSWRIAGATTWRIAALPTGTAMFDALTFDCLQRRDNANGYASTQAMLSDYYAAINGQNYARAYSLWKTPQQTYEQFAAGFADTSEVVLFAGEMQRNTGGGSTLEVAAVPVVLFGYHTDGSVTGYQGCFRLSYDAAAAVHLGILGANLVPLRMVVMPGESAVVAGMTQACY